jgi:hypothetical protein
MLPHHCCALVSSHHAIIRQNSALLTDPQVHNQPAVFPRPRPKPPLYHETEGEQAMSYPEKREEDVTLTKWPMKNLIAFLFHMLNPFWHYPLFFGQAIQSFLNGI